jgi:membrane protein YqaA with SNARE-associated domain
MIGAWLYDSVGHWIINIFSSPEQFALAQELFDKHWIMIILIASFTPIPFKILTLCAGFLGFAPLLYLSFTAVGRTLRFIISGWLLWRFQEKANSIVKKYFWWLLLGAVLITCLGLLILRFV